MEGSIEGIFYKTSFFAKFVESFTSSVQYSKVLAKGLHLIDFSYVTQILVEIFVLKDLKDKWRNEPK